jgi:hypothetical protein
MKQKHLLIIIFSFLSLNLGCKETPTEPNTGNNDTPKTSWESITVFEKLDIRYMIQINNRIYVACINPFLTSLDTNATRGMIFESKDGTTWTKIFTTKYDVGPMAVHGDSLFIICRDSIYYYLPDEGFRGKFKPPPRVQLPAEIGDMTFYKGNLYIMGSITAPETWCVYPDGSYEIIKTMMNIFSNGGAKFIKLIKGGVEKVYVRAMYGTFSYTIIWEFDGNLFHLIDGGLTEAEKNAANPSNSLVVKNDTLYAGFKSPASVKILINDTWQTVTDSLPYSKSAFQLNPVLKTETTALTFCGDRMFVSTQSIGVLEWLPNKGWEQMSSGLIEHPWMLDGTHKDLYVPVVFLETFNGYLFAGYGVPGYAPWGSGLSGNYGLFIKKIN